MMNGCYKTQLNKELSPSQYRISSLIPRIKLPVLDVLLNKALTNKKRGSLRKTAIYYVHHPLQTSINVIEAIISLGAKPSNIFILGKRYSECESVVSQIMQLEVHYQPCSMQIGLGKYSNSFTRDINWLWAKLISTIGDEIEEILVLDHGGHALAYLPPSLLERYKVIGIEKTTAGLMDLDTHGLPPFPLIGVANCAAKRYLESPLIAEAVVNKLMKYIPIDKGTLTCGVVGFGAIGKAITEQLSAMGHQVIIHDKDKQQLEEAVAIKNVVPAHDLSALIAYSDYIFGCSGRDITQSMLEHFRLATRDKTLISCSSEDKEFLSLIQKIAYQHTISSAYFDPLDNLQYRSNFGATIHILRGGFPVNFDSTGESVPANDIQLTRSLVVAGILQAIEFFKKNHIVNSRGLYALDPSTQHFIVQEWLPYQKRGRYALSLLEKFKDEQWILEQSNGIFESCNGFEQIR